jgi:RNA polymerase sigma-70 factor (ECF subfamily)
MGGRFLTTRWSLVRRAGDEDPARARAALEELCASYWYPLWAFARRAGLDAHAAEDLVQDFLARLVARDALARLAPEGGRFRSFLRVALRNHIASARASERAERRGGGAVRRFVDLDEGERRLAAETPDPATESAPERAFERAWALEVLARALGALRREYEADGRGALVETLLPALQGEDGPALRAAARERLALEPGALRVALHRLRARFRERLVAEVRETVDDPAEVEAELGALLGALAGGPGPDGDSRAGR